MKITMEGKVMKTATQDRVMVLFVVYQCVRAVTGGLVLAGSIVAGAVASLLSGGGWRVDPLLISLFGVLGAWQVLHGLRALWKTACESVERDPAAL